MNEENDVTNWEISKWPFAVGYAVLLGFAYYFILRAPQSIHHWEVAAACVVAGAGFCLLPFYLDYRAMEKALEANALGTFAEKIQNLEKLSEQIHAATNHWAIIQEAVQLEAGKTMAIATEITGKMAGEARQFTEFMQKMNDSEKATLRLEVEKLHRGETEWLQMLVRILDHVFALHTAAVRTGDPKFAEPVTNFQNACRESVRRIGLTPFVAVPDEKFNAELHQAAGENPKPPSGSIVTETVGTGYTFQGKLLRPALVRVREAKAAAVKPAPIAESVSAEKPVAKSADAELPL